MAEDTIGNYRLLGELGRGGMGIIYKAEQKNLGRFVALKVLYPHLVSDPITVKRFNHEARATALLNHPNIVQIFDVGVEEDMHYFAMEYVPGKTLETVLENQDRLGVEETLRIVDQVASALSAAHDVGIIHRDVKPSNILIDDHGRIKVSDFGIAIAAGQGDLTDTGHLVGTARYMSPEHARGEHPDGRSDIYSLGVVMYEMLTGAPPFDGDSPVTILESHVNAPVPPMPSEVPPMVQALVLKCLEKLRVDRPRTVREFRVSLREAAAEIDWQGPALPPLELTEPAFERDPSFRYDRAGIVRSASDTVSFFLAERLRPKTGVRNRLGRALSERLGRRVRHRHDSYKMKRLEVMELRDNLHGAEEQLEEAKQECDRAHEKYEAADEELHGWQMEGSLVLDRGKKFSREAAALQEKRLWQQATSYKLQWQNLQDRVRDWYQNVERARRDLEAAVRELELLKIRRQRTAQKSGVTRRSLARLILVLMLVGTTGLVGLYQAVFRKTLTHLEPRTVYGKFLPPVMMKEARDEHAAAVFGSGETRDYGKVLVTGGIDANRQALDSAEVFDRERGVFTWTGKLQEKRFNHTMTTLADGMNVLVVGGEARYGAADAIRSVELFHGKEGQFVVVSRLNTGRTRHRSVLLADGRVLVTGGSDASGAVLAGAEVFDPSTNSFRPVATMVDARRDHTVTLMPDGRVVVVGGGQAGNRAVDGVEVYDPKTERFEPVCVLNQVRYEHTATALDASHVLIIGGRTGQRITDALDTMELVDLERRTSTVVGRLRLPRRVHTTVLLPDSNPVMVLIVGGAVGETGVRNLCEKFVVGWKETKPAGMLRHDRNNHTATLLGDGSVLFVGGHGHDTGQPLGIAELYVKVPVSLGCPSDAGSAADGP